MNKKRYWLATLVVFIFIFFYDWIFHGVVLRDLYMATASLWRTHEVMQMFFGWIIAGQLLLSIMFCWIFTKGYQQRGLLEGVRYGLYIGILMSAPEMIRYAVQPISLTLLWSWIGGGILEFIIAGIITAAIYRK